MFNQTSKELAEVFGDVETHQKITKIIRKYSANPDDIRETALNKLDLSEAKIILDLGCGFGFFTRALKGRANTEAEITGIDCHPQYRDSYLDSCRQAQIDGKFIGECITSIRRIRSNSIDLILCSYALYFFPEILPHISRILKIDGLFVTITHSRRHLFELGEQVKNVLSKPGDNLPYELLIESFSAENGLNLLRPWFGDIQQQRRMMMFFDKAAFYIARGYEGA
jgi:ubiquinone/menaquinone biosynthesis C-methylase UbiE